MAGSRNFRLHPEFSDARTAFQEEFDNANQAFSSVHDLFSRDTVYALFEGDRADNSFTYRIQDRLVAYVFNHGSGEYRAIATKIDQSAEDVELIRRHLGSYAYWRFNIQGQLVSGEITVGEDDGVFTFAHFNNRMSQEEDNDDLVVANHEGYVFAIKNRLHFHGMGIKYIRPIIANVVDIPEQEYVDGLVMTVQQKTLALMAARFIMIHEAHVEYDMNEESKGFTQFRKKIEARIKRGNSVRGVLITSDE